MLENKDSKSFATIGGDGSFVLILFSKEQIIKN